MQKIKSLTLRNFKYFYGKETDKETQHNRLELNSQNLLLYGENGSGKSSIYWALYTFLQSSIKESRSEIEKYFDPERDQNLRNRFAQPNDESGIIVEFDSESGITTKQIKRDIDRSYSINTFDDTFTKKVLIGSDFINYKYLAKIYDFRNSEPIDLFDMFEREIFMFIDFEEAFKELDGTLTTKTYASDWWKFICEGHKTLPRNINKIAERTEEYILYQIETIPKFIALLKRFLLDITQGANEFLEKEFKEDFRIKFDIDAIECIFNKRIDGKNKQKDGKLHKPKIPLQVIFNHHSLATANKEIIKPHTFLNEARLTAIALSIRLSILDRRPEFTNSVRILVFDDLLLSLDMSHRDKVLDILLSDNFIRKYQILILSHDRAFYNMCKNRIQDRFETGWIFKEMYQHETNNGIPCPFIPEQSNYLDLAKKYLKEFDYPASANYLRKETESALCNLLPKNLTLFDKNNEGSKIVNLETLISRFKDYFTSLGGDFTPYRKLKEHKDLILNPLSHDNTHSPIYKLELVNLIGILEILNSIKVKTVIDVQFEPKSIFELRVYDNNNENWVYEFYPLETFRVLKLPQQNWLIKYPKCQFVRRKNLTQNLAYEDINKSFMLEYGYEKIRYTLGTKTNEIDNIKDLKEIVFKDGQRLIDMLNG
jgi:energy-coupling factor transporter ATP-binding protein EcfA2